MTEQQYNDLLHALGKEAFSEMVKADIRQRVQEHMQVYTVSSLMMLSNLLTSCNMWRS